MMTFSNCSTEHKKYKHLTYENRIQIETYLRDKLPKAEIARRLNISRQTLDNEIKRGAQPHLKILKHRQRLYLHHEFFREILIQSQKSQIIHFARKHTVNFYMTSHNFKDD
ncbi:helix-turn-helix domain-containing protein [Lactovum odontotermitis]